MEILILGWYNFTATGSVLLLGVCWLKQPERDRGAKREGDVGAHEIVRSN
jgi:hypothetical protein